MPKELFRMDSPLLMAMGDGSGDFVRWLKKVGIDDNFLRVYPLSRLVEWGWLRPQYRIVFPEVYFSDGSIEAQMLSREAVKNDPTVSELWDITCFNVGEEDPMWFIHPFFTPQSKAGQLLNQNSTKSGLPEIPPPIEMANGTAVSPYADYFYPWQAFALLDVIRAADRFGHFVMDTPDVQTQVESLTRSTKTPTWNPHKYLEAQDQWGGLAEVMTWLEHYAVLKSAVKQREMHYGHVDGLLRRGAKALANHLGFDAACLEVLVKDRLLVLAQRWSWRVAKHDRWIAGAYPHLQERVYLAVHWLCMLTGNTLDHYLDLWRHPTHSDEAWAELHAVLPFEYYGIRDKFLTLAPFYLKPFNERLAERHRLEGDRLTAVVDAIRVKSRHFNVFMGAFKKLHDELGGDRNPNDVIDLRERQPLDYYLLLAIKAEVCFREELRKTGDLGSGDKQKLSGYLEHLGIRTGLDETAIELFKHGIKTCTKLHSEPVDGIRRILNLGSKKPSGQVALVQAMVCCELARNYFAHHDYMDVELLNGQDSQFLLGGILVSVLVLLG